MDPLSLTASIIVVLGLASETSKALRTLYDLRHAPREILELTNEVSELQALLCLVQKATDSAVQNHLSAEDQVLIQRLIETAQDPLKKLEGLIDMCSSKKEMSSGSVEKSSLRLSVSWLKLKNSISNIRKRFLRAHRNIDTALAALNNINRQADYKVILNIHDLVLTQAQASEHGISPASPETVQNLEQKFNGIICDVNEEKTGELFKESILPVPAARNTMTREIAEKKFDSYYSHEDEPGLFENHATIRASIATPEHLYFNFDHAITEDANNKRPSHASSHTIFRSG
ncbi:hypothetical protein TSTA_046350 [Talaromyces stipitatus ATCC 10500]|uniref:Azaphilone pigments biosynthesis cluster protein L N-terminal domain-containing protein n=1 Tax=Talaromyces stipitatus (strain ATCC 10500 / CBS 375.48 / QM 6759 / NRRL 1006) TaxID=441959 RepID=B8MJI1_TALSN|nr:uncharacterized protein TSTA_046350 [Talaromyces stipitatus ATCC 10500]EED15181.1 hypothetical protein TSTA_046350 [Talaromyces stipitatus ATCC 10500]